MSLRGSVSVSDRRGGWYKIKPHLGVLPDTLDLIVIGGFFAQGTRRRELVGPIDYYQAPLPVAHGRVWTCRSLCFERPLSRHSAAQSKAK